MLIAGTLKPTFFSLRGPAEALQQRAPKARFFYSCKMMFSYFSISPSDELKLKMRKAAVASKSINAFIDHIRHNLAKKEIDGASS